MKINAVRCIPELAGEHATLLFLFQYFLATVAEFFFEQVNKHFKKINNSLLFLSQILFNLKLVIVLKII